MYNQEITERATTLFLENLFAISLTCTNPIFIGQLSRFKVCCLKIFAPYLDS